jgi:hypothetical protein
VLIEAAERRLGLSFSPSYRHFMLQAGCGGVDGEQFYGLVPAGLDALGTERRLALRGGDPERKAGEVLRDLRLGDGTEVALDLDRPAPAGETPCVAAHAGNRTHTEEVAPDFGAFFLTRSGN